MHFLSLALEVAARLMVLALEPGLQTDSPRPYPRLMRVHVLHEYLFVLVVPGDHSSADKVTGPNVILVELVVIVALVQQKEEGYGLQYYY